MNLAAPHPPWSLTCGTGGVGCRVLGRKGCRRAARGPAVFVAPAVPRPGRLLRVAVSVRFGAGRLRPTSQRVFVQSVQRDRNSVAPEVSAEDPLPCPPQFLQAPRTPWPMPAPLRLPGQHPRHSGHPGRSPHLQIPDL